MTSPVALATLQRQRLIEMIRAAGLSHVEATIVARMRTSIRVFTSLAEQPLVIASSRFGGPPDLLPDVVWPVHEGVPMCFLAQFNLAELAACDLDDLLPHTGLLSVFVVDDYRSDGYGEVGRIVFTPASEFAQLTTHAVPKFEDGEFRMRVLARCDVRFEVEICIPPIEGPASDDLFSNPEDRSRYWDEVWMDRNHFANGPYHRIGGYPDMNFNQHFGTSIQLVQIDYDDPSSWEFGDAQPLRALIEPGALASGDWQRVWFNADQ